MTGPVRDRLGRPLTDLRVSVTDRCNFRCGYCMPRGVYGPDFAFVPRQELLTFEEIARVVAVATSLGVGKVRLTGGEPLLRRDLHRLVAQLAALPGVEDLALTTNGALLAAHAERLHGSGLRRVTVSLDALDDATFQAMSDVTLPVARVLEGLAAAVDVGLAPVKINTVVRRGVNEHAIDDLVEFGRAHGHLVRFIEYMDVGTTNGWRLADVVPAREVLARIAARHPIEPVGRHAPNEVAERWRYRDGAGEVGVIASVTRPFCGSCTRARLSATGELYTCLFAARGRDLRPLLRGGASDEEVADLLAGVWADRSDRYSELRSEATATLPKVEMSFIGG